MKNNADCIIRAMRMCIFSSILLFLVGCDKEEDLFLGGEVSPTVQRGVKDICIDWTKTRSELTTPKDCDLVSEQDGVVVFQQRDKEYSVSYQFQDGCLVCAVMLMPECVSGIDISALSDSYVSLGEMSNCSAYVSTELNTVACYWAEFGEGLSAIGFSALKSDIIDEAFGITVQVDEMEVSLPGARCRVSCRGVSKAAYLGVEFSLSPDFDNCDLKGLYSASGVVSTVSVLGLFDNMTYYYRGIAIVDGEKIYGDVKSLHTDDMVYFVDGKPHKMITVEGGPFGSFSIMEVELPLGSTLKIGDLSVVADANPKTKMTKGEFRDFLYYNLHEKTHLPWRLPTPEEWKLAAMGGVESKGYAYSGSDDVEEVAWYRGNASKAMPLGMKMPNELGLYDMSGNYAELVCEGVDDYIRDCNFGSAYYFNPMWENLRGYGGNFRSDADGCTVQSYYHIPGVAENVFDPSVVCLRLVYSRRHHFKSALHFF